MFLDWMIQILLIATLYRIRVHYDDEGTPTGAAGFIGSNLVKRLFKDVKGATIIGIDNIVTRTEIHRVRDGRLDPLRLPSRTPRTVPRVLQAIHSYHTG